MNYKEYTTILKSQILKGYYEHQLKFAVLICEKLYFDYQKFTETENWGNADLLMDAIRICQKAINNPVDTNQIKCFLPEIDQVTPDTNDFGDWSGSYALNASASVYETLEFILDKDNTHIYNIGTLYTDTIDFKIQEEKDLTDQEIEKHPRMIEAWNFIIEQTKNGA
jgi:uncharacterized protein YjaG (DUF416 family)